MSTNTLIAFISEWLGAVAVAWLLSISPNLQFRRVGFRYARRDGLVALGIYVLLLVFSFIFFGVNAPMLRPNFRLAPAPVINLTQALLLAGLGLAPVLVGLVARKQPPKSTGWNNAPLRSALSVGIATGLLTLFLHNQVMNVLNGVSSAEFFALLTAFGISLAEETVFRGYIQMRLTWWLGDWPGIFLTAALFALWHLPAWLSQLPSETILSLAGLTFVQGLVLGWVMLKSGNVLGPAVYRAVSIWMQIL